MLTDNQPVEKKRRTALSVVQKKTSRSVKVIKMLAPDSVVGGKQDLRPPASQFNTRYMKARNHDPL
jgi:hypothetical protein